MKTLTTVQRLLTKAKLRLRTWVPYLTHIFSMMRTVETKDVPTMAVDQYNRLYCNPEFMESLSLGELAYCLLHEVMHVVLSHCRRFKAAVPQATERERYAWNVAGDLVIQQMLARLYGEHEPSGIIRIDGCIPNTSVDFLSIPGLSRGMMVEQYFGLLLPHIPPQPQGDGGNPLDPMNAGSNSDGTPREYEKQPTVADCAMVDHALREAEKKIEKAEATSPGSVPGQLRQALKARLHKQPDPFNELRTVITRTVANPAGQEEFTYAVYNRRQQADGVRRRGVRRWSPECTIIIDTSGSMRGYESRALTTIAQGLRRVQRPRVVAFDSQIQEAKRISSLSEFTFCGYGGTDMTAAITDEDRRRPNPPDCIVLVTDGETSWPTQPTRAKLVIALVKGGVTYSQPPSWAKVIDLTKEGPGYAG